MATTSGIGLGCTKSPKLPQSETRYFRLSLNVIKDSATEWFDVTIESSLSLTLTAGEPFSFMLVPFSSLFD